MNRLFPSRYLLSLLCLGFCLMISQSVAFSQSCPGPSFNALGFPPGTRVPVYIDPAIVGDRRTQAIQAFTNWANASLANGSGISFEFLSQPPSPNTGIIVNNQAPATGNRAHTDAITNDHTGYTMSAVIQIAPGMTSPAAVLEALAHEIGHVYGLADCGQCSVSQSTMAIPGYPQGFNQVTGRATSPTDCDNQTVSRIYTPCDIQGRSACYYNSGIWNELACACNTVYGGSGGGNDGDPCGGDPTCGDPCANDPTCGDPCGGDPNCGWYECDWQEYCTQTCWTQWECMAEDYCGNCYWYAPVEYCDEPSCEWYCDY